MLNDVCVCLCGRVGGAGMRDGVDDNSKFEVEVLMLCESVWR